MYVIAPLSSSGSCLFSNAALIADRISALERPAITILLPRKAIGNIQRAAWGFRQSAAFTFGFQNSGQSNAAIQPLATQQTNPFFPVTVFRNPDVQELAPLHRLKWTPVLRCAPARSRRF